VGREKSLKDEPKKGDPRIENRGRSLSIMPSNGLIILILLSAVVIWYGFYATHTKEVAGSDDREYASIARNIVNGKGIVRNFIYPIDVNFFDKLPVPEFMHPPGYPLILAGFFKLFGISDFAALLPSYLSYFILVLLIFFFTKRFLEIKTATIAAVILIFNKEILDASIIALSEAVYTLLFFLFFISFVKAKSLRALFVTGILLGISHLIRQNLYPFILPLFVYLYFYPNRPPWKKMTFFTIGILVPMIPNMARSFWEAGSPFFSYGKFALMAFTQKYPWLNIYRDIQNPSLFEFLIGEPGHFMLKYLDNLVSAIGQILTVSNPYLLAFFMVEMFYWKIDPEWKRIKILFLFLLISQMLFIPLFTFTQRFFLPFLPMMIVFAAQGFLRSSEGLLSAVKRDWKKRALSIAIFLFVIFFVTPSIYTILKPYKPPLLDFKTSQFGYLMPRSEANRLNEFLKNELKENKVVWTDLPEILEWEADRLCGWLPTQIKTIYEIHKKIPVDAILLTSLRTPYKMEEEWKYLLFSELSLPRYRTVKVYRGGVVFAKLLIRDEAE
jgi:4-amino-4-deoxy-L-arabinose transferase-like glycosyltransferase